MAGGHPFNGLHLVEAVAESVQRIAGDAPDTLYASLLRVFAMYAATVCFMVVLLLYVISLTSLEESRCIACSVLFKYRWFSARRAGKVKQITGCRTGSRHNIGRVNVVPPGKSPVALTLTGPTGEPRQIMRAQDRPADGTNMPAHSPRQFPRRSASWCW